MRVAIVIAATAAILLTGGGAVILSTGATQTPLLPNCYTFDFEAEIAATDRALAMGRSTPDETVAIRAWRDEALQIDREAHLLNRTNPDEVQKAVWHRDDVMGRALEKLGVRWIVKGQDSSETPPRAWYEEAWNAWHALPACG
jgi:hypothetical protein